MKTIQSYIESCLVRGKLSAKYELQCQSCSGSAQEKIGLKILEAEFAEEPTYVVWFGNGFDRKFIETCKRFPVRGNFKGLLSVEEFCQKALAGDL